MARRNQRQLLDHKPLSLDRHKKKRDGENMFVSVQPSYNMGEWRNSVLRQLYKSIGKSFVSSDSNNLNIPSNTQSIDLRVFAVTEN